MSSTSASHGRELLVVDLRGMKAALLMEARARGVTVSWLVRDALAKQQVGGSHEGSPSAATPCSTAKSVRVSLRLSGEAAELLSSSAAKAGLPLGAFVVELLRSASKVPSAVERAALVGALARSNAELSTLSRYVSHLTSLLRQGSVDAARVYRQMLDTLDADVRAHLKLAAEVRAFAVSAHRSSKQEVQDG